MEGVRGKEACWERQVERGRGRGVERGQVLSGDKSRERGEEGSMMYAIIKIMIEGLRGKQTDEVMFVGGAQEP